MKKLAVLLVVLVLTVLLGCGQEPAIEPNGRRVLVGVMLPPDGVSTFKGERGRAGIKNELTYHPLLNDGTAIKVFFRYVADEPEAGAAALRRLAENDRVVAVVSFLSSDAMLAMAPVADEVRLPLVAASATHPQVIVGREYVSRLIYDDTFQGAVAALYARDELLLERAAIFSDPENSYSRFLAAEFASKFTSVGGRVVADLRVDAVDWNFYGELSLLRRQNPDLLYLTLAGDDLETIVKALKLLDWVPAIIVPDGALSNLLARHSKPRGLYDGIIGTDVFSPQMPASSLGRRYSIFQRNISKELDTYSVLGIEAMVLLRDSLNRCAELALDRECLRKSIRETRNLLGIVGPIEITPEGRAIRPVVINSIEKGRLKFLVRVQ